jgi:hypothetical protein
MAYGKTCKTQARKVNRVNNQKGQLLVSHRQHPCNANEQALHRRAVLRHVVRCLHDICAETTYRYAEVPGSNPATGTVHPAQTEINVPVTLLTRANVTDQQCEHNNNVSSCCRLADVRIFAAASLKTWHAAYNG